MAWDRPGTWTYTGNPADSSKDRVRWLCGDTLDSDPQVSDEEIAAAVADEANVYDAAALVCDHLSARFAREAQRSLSAGGGLNTSVSLSERSKAYAARAKVLRDKGATYAVGVHAGGISRSAVEANESDTDLVQPGFYVGMFEDPGRLPRDRGRE